MRVCTDLYTGVTRTHPPPGFLFSAAPLLASSSRGPRGGVNRLCARGKFDRPGLRHAVLSELKGNNFQKQGPRLLSSFQWSEVLGDHELGRCRNQYNGTHLREGDLEVLAQ